MTSASVKTYRRAALALQHWLQLTQRHGSLIRAFTGDGQIEAHIHYPQGDLIDPTSGTQCYYHCHRGDGEHGHLHLFRRTRDDAPLSHLIAISLDARGMPVGFFTVNRWVTGDHWLSASQAADLLPGVSLHQASYDPSVTEWLTHFLHCYRPVVKQLLLQRDQRIAESGLTITTALECRSLEVLSRSSIDWAADLALLDNKHASVLQTKQGP